MRKVKNQQLGQCSEPANNVFELVASVLFSVQRSTSIFLRKQHSRQSMSLRWKFQCLPSFECYSDPLYSFVYTLYKGSKLGKSTNIKHFCYFGTRKVPAKDHLGYMNATRKSSHHAMSVIPNSDILSHGFGNFTNDWLAIT